MENNYSYIPIRSPLSRWQQKILSTFFVLFLYFCFVGIAPFGDRLLFELKDMGQGDTTLRNSYLIIAFVVSLYIAIRQDLRFIKLIGIPILLSLGWAVFSMFWSYVPEVTLRRSMFVVIIVFTIFSTTSLLGPQKIFKILFYVLLVLIIASLISGLIVPGAVHRSGIRGTEDLIGRWRGVFYHKNIAGAASAFLFLISIQQIIYGKMIQNTYHLWIGAVSSLLMLFLAFSKTSLGLIVPSMLISALFQYFIIKRNIWHRLLLLVGIAIFLLLAGMWAMSSDAFKFLDEPGAVTGRSELWSSLLRMVPESPILGYGYGAIFDVGEKTPLLGYTTTWVLRASHAHNGFLQVIVEQGTIGLILALLAFIILPLWKVVTSPNIPKEIFAPLTSIMTFFVLNNMTETTLMLKNVCQWVVYIIALSILSYYVRHELFYKSKSAQSSINSL